MGLIKAVTSAVGGVVADQWEEYFYCDSLDADVLVTKGHKRQKGRGAGNNKRISHRCQRRTVYDYRRSGQGC